MFVLESDISTQQAREAVEKSVHIDSSLSGDVPLQAHEYMVREILPNAWKVNDRLDAYTPKLGGISNA